MTKSLFLHRRVSIRHVPASLETCETRKTRRPGLTADRCSSRSPTAVLPCLPCCRVCRVAVLPCLPCCRVAVFAVLPCCRVAVFAVLPCCRVCRVSVLPCLPCCRVAVLPCHWWATLTAFSQLITKTRNLLFIGFYCT